MDLEFTHAVGPQTDGLQNHLGNLIDILYFESPSLEIPSQEMESLHLLCTSGDLGLM